MNNILDFHVGCTGCGACSLVCTNGAISMSIDDEGFFSAKIDEKQCIECGLCKSVCIQFGVKNATSIMSGEMVSAQSKDKAKVLSCTSGGIAQELTNYALSIGMSVCGVQYDYDKHIAVSKIACDIQDAASFRGSKYLQSECFPAYDELIKRALSNKKSKYLVFGTPCQIYGLATVLEKKHLRERFVLVDLFCHGVPSYLVWNNYLNTIYKKVGNIKQVNFRDKRIGWHNFVISIEGEEGKYKEASEGDLFYRCFFDNVLFSRACFNCEVRKEFSKADIRLGDFWGRRYQDREDGVSAVLMLTSVGKDYILSLTNVDILEHTSVEEVLHGQSVHSYTTDLFRDNAINDLKKFGDLKKTIRNYRKEFAKKQRVKLFMKEITAKLPDSLRAKLRYLYRMK